MSPGSVRCKGLQGRTVNPLRKLQRFESSTHHETWKPPLTSRNGSGGGRGAVMILAGRSSAQWGKISRTGRLVRRPPGHSHDQGCTLSASLVIAGRCWSASDGPTTAQTAQRRSKAGRQVDVETRRRSPVGGANLRGQRLLLVIGERIHESARVGLAVDWSYPCSWLELPRPVGRPYKLSCVSVCLCVCLSACLSCRASPHRPILQARGVVGLLQGSHRRRVVVATVTETFEEVR